MKNYINWSGISSELGLNRSYIHSKYKGKRFKTIVSFINSKNEEIQEYLNEYIRKEKIANEIDNAIKEMENTDKLEKILKGIFKNK
ncbi:MAG: hypothetical protein OEV44_00185 [Spirochaetota bacterium]|nr:hypothetical protein [Spirochaetota bacterium]